LLRTTNVIVAALFLIGVPTISSAEPVAKAEPPHRSATKARDIGGFALGMHIRDAAKLAAPESIGGNQFNAEHDGRSFNFEVTPLGRIFRIQSSQPLGRFVVDSGFAATVLSKLTAKYGQPLSSEFGSYGWQLTEPVRHANGQTLPFTTMWMSAYISSYPGVSDVSLEMKMIDFRLLWEDEVKINKMPRDVAIGRLAF
jgi:hypothetical protein